MSRTLAQERSAFALVEVSQIRSETKKEFLSLVQGLPAMILQNGFGQALSFLLAKNNQQHRDAFRIIARWLEKRGILTTTENVQVMNSISNFDQQLYLQSQRETLALLEWVKRYAKAFFEGE
ncbi:MAG TPA: type III-B CRISPR module-associated protein Cmr5 [Desulfobacterales bacterium]|nr:type III-B CRISPR module-associated protein Cmr5 [Desulfobacterales bacterium]